MNREAVVLNKRVLSIYDSELLEVDKWLIRQGLMVHSRKPSIDLILESINKENANDIRRQGIFAFEKVLNTIISK